MTDTVISVKNISKRYRIGVKEKTETFAQQFANLLVYPIKNLRRIASLSSFKNGEDPTVFWALKDINFEVKRGEVLGIIGRNGAGKSTLLKILSRITEPTTGEIEIHGRVSSLLEVGTGFHPELTGRDNVYMNGTILGMTKKEIDRKFDEIVDFSGIEKHIDTPVKFYSSGMTVRLAFSVAAHLEPEILIIDEVLAVGDAEFQKKCLGKMEDVAGQGRTVLFVSHNMAAVRNLCHKGILLQGGRKIIESNIEEATRYYLSDNIQNIDNPIFTEVEDTKKDAQILEVITFDDQSNARNAFLSDENINIGIKYELRKNFRNIRLVFQLVEQYGEIAFASTNHNINNVEQRPGIYSTTVTIPKNLLNAKSYLVKLHIGIPGVMFLSEPKEYIKITISNAGHHGSNFNEKWPGIIAPKLEWKN